MKEAVIYHNPRCSKSRETLALLQQHGIQPQVIEYLKTPPSVAQLQRILTLMGKSPRDILRSKEAQAAGIDATTLTDSQLIEKMVAVPEVIERPIVVFGETATLGRPPENVLKIIM